jgi:uncharacterized short protein YbdD (DUF466 family)
MGRLTDSARKVRWYIGTLMGDTHYQRYVDYRLRVHPGEPVVSERDYWRMRHNRTESSPDPRCC